MSAPSEERIRAALAVAESEFWASVASSFPEAQTGDYQGEGLAGETGDAALRHWLLLNYPRRDWHVEMRPTEPGADRHGRRAYADAVQALCEAGRNLLAAELAAEHGTSGVGSYLPLEGETFAVMAEVGEYSYGQRDRGTVISASDWTIHVQMQRDLRVLALLPSDDIGATEIGQCRPQNVGVAFWSRFSAQLDREEES